MRRLWWLWRLGMLLGLTACQTEVMLTPTAVIIPTPLQLPTSTVTISPTATIVPLPTVDPTPIPLPEPTLTPAALRLQIDTAVPAPLTADLQPYLPSDLVQFVGEGAGGDVRLAVNEGTVVANWIYAVVAPFPTLADEITLVEAREAWQTGQFMLDEETAAVLTTLWGTPNIEPLIVPVAELAAALWAVQNEDDTPALSVVPFEQLTPQLKALRLDDVSPLAMDFDPAGYSLTVSVGLVGEAERATQISEHLPGLLTNRDDGRITHIVMSGPAGMRRAVADRMDKYGIQYPGEETGPVLQAADIAHMSNENAFAPDCPPANPFDSDDVCNRTDYFELMTWMGIDVNEMTGNHLNDWGTAAMVYTLDLYADNGIQVYGGGRNLAEAQRPLLLEHNGNRIAFVGCNPTGPEYDWATADQPGSLPCGDYSQLKSLIRKLADEGYFVVVTLQYLEDYQYGALAEQRQLFQSLAAAGAAAVSGSHAHHPQGFSFAHDSFIHYGLGNLLADQMWSLGSRQMFLDVYTVYNGHLLNVTLWTGLNEDYARVRQMMPQERHDLLQAVFAASDW
ncbi:MAG: hypothetical protein GY796_33745 [Chloroflexi bacterium]|nr:hypothetical protein [Chloroflexota bacterium]